MSSSSAASRLSPELRAAVYHFSVFGTAGVATVYFGIWLANRGIPPDEIGLINAAPVAAMLLVNQVVGRLADRAGDWRQMILILSLISGAASIGLFFVSGFWGILLVWTLAVLPAFSLVPIVDAATLRMTERRGTDFGAVRAWGTVGFMAVTVLSGPVVGYFGDGAFVPLFVAMAGLRALLAVQLPRFRAPAETEARHAGVGGAGRLHEVMRPWFLLTLAGLGILYSTHGALGGFAALLWKEQGIPEGLIGPLFGIMAAAEAMMMFLWKRLRITIPARNLIIFAALVGVVRWGAMAFSPPVWALFGLQLLHSITFGVGYMGGMYFIANWTREEIAAEAQGFSFLVQQAMSVVAIVGMGWCVALWSNGAWLALAAYSLVGALLVMLSIRMQPPAVNPSPVDAEFAIRPDGLLP